MTPHGKVTSKLKQSGKPSSPTEKNISPKHPTHPFVSGPIAKFLGPHKWNNVSEQILAGTFDINSITNDVDV
jgi:hypothetical protein